MDLGKKLKQARMDAGLSQRQLCGEKITRNMLSQIENGLAKPSMSTLSYLAEKLERPVSFFLEEDAVSSPNQQRIRQAREAFMQKNWEALSEILNTYCSPDEMFDPEFYLLSALARLEQTRQALDQRRFPYAGELLHQSRLLAEKSCYAGPELMRRILLLEGEIYPERRQTVAENLPDLDEELLLRAEAALQAGQPKRCGALLEAAEDQNSPRWNYLRGEGYLACGAYSEAAACYHRAEQADPQKMAARLEQCYREMDDYKQAYYYACMQKKDAL